MIPLDKEDEFLTMLEDSKVSPSVRKSMALWKYVGDLFPTENFNDPFNQWTIGIVADRILIYRPTDNRHSLLFDLMNPLGDKE